MHLRRLISLTAFGLFTFLAAAGEARAGIDVGVRGGYYTDAEAPFLGAEAILPVSGNVWFNPNFEYVFVDSADYYTVNADFHYDLPHHGRPFYWLGAGVGLSRFDIEGPAEGETDVIANLFAGVGVRSGSVIPYAQAKVILKDDTEFVIGFGLRF